MNPFKPTAGKMPPILIGRENVLNDSREALINGAGAPGRIMLLTGQSGYGKTVLLTQLNACLQYSRSQAHRFTLHCRRVLILLDSEQ